ncbi:MAG: hypothetical protein ABIH63_04200 [archaeon]
MLRYTKVFVFLLFSLLIPVFVFSQQPTDKMKVCISIEDRTPEKKFQANLKDWFTKGLVDTGRYVITKERKEAQYQMTLTLDKASFYVLRNLPYTGVSLNVVVSEIDPKTGKALPTGPPYVVVQHQKHDITLEEAVKEAVKQAADALRLFHFKFHFKRVNPTSPANPLSKSKAA